MDLLPNESVEAVNLANVMRRHVKQLMKSNFDSKE